MTEPAVVKTWLALAPVPALVAALVAVAEGEVRADILQSAVLADGKARGRSGFTRAQLDETIRGLVGARLLNKGRAIDMGREVREPILRHLLHAGRYDHFVALVAAHEPLVRPRYTYGGAWNKPNVIHRELRRALYTGQSETYAELRQWLAPSYLAPMLVEPFEEGVVRRCSGLMLVEALQHLGIWHQRTLKPLPSLVPLLVEALAREPSPRLRAMLVEEAVLQGDLATARAALAGARDPTEAGAALGLLHLATGDIPAAEATYASVLTAERRRLADHKLLLPGLAGVFLPVAYLLKGTAQRRKQALRLVDLSRSDGTWPEAHEGWMALAPLLDPERRLMPQPLENEHPASVLVEALGRAWADQPFAQPERIDAAVSRARGAGYHWLADELEATRAEAPARRGDFVPLVVHRQAEPAWVRHLDALEAQLPAQAAGGERLAWFLETDPLDLSARIQKAGRSGWSKGTVVSQQRLLQRLADVACATDQDRVIAAGFRAELPGRAHWARMDDWGEVTWPHLVGHPHLFDARSGKPVTVVARAPRLVVEPVKGGRRLRLEPPMRGSVKVTPVGALGYEVTALDRHQRALADQVGGGLVLPTGALPRLQGLLERIGAVLEVSEGGEDGLEVAGAPGTVARLSRAGAGLRCELVVQPAGPDGPALPAGQGSALILARADGRARRVRRDLDAEQAHLAETLSALPLLEQAEWTGEGWLVPELADALELLDQLGAIRDRVPVQWREGDPLRVQQPGSRGLHLRIELDEGWFEARGELAVDEGEVLQLAQLLRLVPRRQGRFLPLGEDRFLALSADLARRLDEAERAGRAGREGLRVHPLAAPALAALAEEATTEAAPAWGAHLEALAAPPPPAEPPIGLEADLRPYQLDGFRWLSRLAAMGVGACLADDMGLGKTVQALALLLARASLGPSLVVAPTSVCSGWREQSWRFTPDLVVYDLRLGDRQKMLDQLVPGDVVVCSYGLLLSEQERLAAIPWATLVLDESQAIKNPQTQRHQAARSLSAGFRLALSGTPVENRLDELWAQMAVLNPGMLGSEAHFRSRFSRPVAEGDRQALRQLRRLVHPVVLRRTKAEVLEELPEKTIVDVPVVLEGEEATVYEALRREAEAATLSGGDQRFELLAWLTRLRLAACHPRLAVEHATTEESAKLAALGDIVDSLQEGQHRALIFSQFTRHLDLVQAWLSARGVAWQRLDGSTPPAERERRVAAFQQGEGLVFLISLRAGGFGLNLTGADYVVHLDPWWNPAVEAQASDRAHRIGQTRPVTVYRLFAADTVEERILHLQHEKRAVAEALMEGADAAAGLSLDELRGVLLGD